MQFLVRILISRKMKIVLFVIIALAFSFQNFAKDNDQRRKSISHEVGDIFYDTPEYSISSLIDYSAGEHSTLLIEYSQLSLSITHMTDWLEEKFTVWGTGWNPQGMFGNGTTTDQKNLTSLFEADIRRVSAGYFHALFLHADGSLWTSGFNHVGQLGNGTSSSELYPVKVIENGVIEVETGANHSLFIKEDSSLWGFGRNSDGELGIANETDQWSPIKIVNKDVISVSAGGFSTIFIMNDGSLWGMGENDSGQLGLESTKSINIPTQIISQGVVSSSCGWGFSVFIKEDGSLWGMGDNQWGQLGNGSTKSVRAPIMIEPSGVLYASAGGGQLLYIKEDGSLWGVGRNDGGRLGTGNQISQKVPVKIENSGVVSVSAGGSFSLFLKDDGSLWGMGDNFFGQLGQGSGIEDILYPVQLTESASITSSYLVTTSSSIGGKVEGGGLIPSNQFARLTALPENGYRFQSWSEDIESFQNPLTFRRFSNVSVKANFTEDHSDDDGDGLSNFDELVIHDTDPSNPDSDGDGISDKAEIEQGKNPNSPDADYAGQEDGGKKQTGLITPFVNGWFYEPTMGWLFTNNLAYPFIYDSINSSWMYFKSGSDFPKFWHYGKKQWIELK